MGLHKNIFGVFEKYQQNDWAEITSYSILSCPLTNVLSKQNLNYILYKNPVHDFFVIFTFKSSSFLFSPILYRLLCNKDFCAWNISTDSTSLGVTDTQINTSFGQSLQLFPQILLFQNFSQENCKNSVRLQHSPNLPTSQQISNPT